MIWGAFIIYFGKVAIVFLAFILVVARFALKGYMINAKGLKTDFIKFYLAHRRKMDWILFGLCCCVLIPSFIFYGFPMVLDIPSLIEDRYETVCGYAITQSVGGVKDMEEERSISIKDSITGEEIVLHCFDTGIYEGEYIKAYYLPNSHIGVIVERNAEKLNNEKMKN